MSSRIVRHPLFHLFFTVLLTGNLAWGQESRATVLGRVTDPSGALVVGAKVRATNVAMNTTGASVTNDQGNYEIPYLLPGLYRVEVELPVSRKPFATTSN